MGTINVTSYEFADVAMIYLFDQVMNPEQVTNERMIEFINNNRGKLKSPLMAYYFDTSAADKFRYRRIGGVFDGSDKSIQQIRIGPDTESKEKDKKKEGMLKKAVKNVIKKVLAKEEFSLEDMKMLKEIQDAYDEIHEETDIQ